MSIPIPAAVTPTPGPETDLATLLAEPASPVWYRRPVLWLSVLLLALAAAGLWYWQDRQIRQRRAHLHDTHGSARQSDLDRHCQRDFATDPLGQHRQ